MGNEGELWRRQFAYVELQRAVRAGAWVFGDLGFREEPEPEAAAAEPLAVGCLCRSTLTRDDSSNRSRAWPRLLCSCLEEARNVWCRALDLVNKPECCSASILPELAGQPARGLQTEHARH